MYKYLTETRKYQEKIGDTMKNDNKVHNIIYNGPKQKTDEMYMH